MNRSATDGEPVLRRADVRDAATLAAFARRVFDETFAAQNNPADMEAYMAAAFSVEQTRAELACEQSIFFVAEAGGALCGYAKLHRGERPDCVAEASAVELARLYVDAPWHGRGVADALMRVLLRQAAAWGGRALWLGVWEHNHRARRFYRRWGFEHAGAHPFILGSDHQTDLVLVRSIARGAAGNS
ncbi:MAG: Spermidine/spermine N(1)-acetyltransferase [Phycisphaerae bacterium]|nr:Spermidine/spermine N(1)-acetyltransferase [Phycisphaerae bacterium]